MFCCSPKVVSKYKSTTVQFNELRNSQSQLKNGGKQNLYKNQQNK